MDSFIGWIGGKRLLRKTICSHFPAAIERYVEVFGGAGWVLLYKDKHADFEVYNDVNSELVNLFRCVKYHPEAVQAELEYLLNAREQFDCFIAQTTKGMTDIQRAARFFFLIKTSYGCNTREYGGLPRKVALIRDIQKIQQRLEKVIIENKSFEKVIRQYDRTDALFYCDPSYYGAEKFYKSGGQHFTEEQHLLLKDTLAGIRGKFLLSYNDCPYIRALYQDYQIIEITRQSNLTNRYETDRQYRELIIKNY